VLGDGADKSQDSFRRLKNLIKITLSGFFF